MHLLSSEILKSVLFVFFSKLVTIKLVFHLPPRTDFLIFRCLLGYKLSTLLLTSQSSGIRWKRTAQGMILVRSITTLSPLSYLSVDFGGLMSSSAAFIPQNSPHHLHKYLALPELHIFITFSMKSKL